MNLTIAERRSFADLIKLTAIHIMKRDETSIDLYADILLEFLVRTKGSNALCHCHSDALVKAVMGMEEK